jgi:hypothetical protein
MVLALASAGCVEETTFIPAPSPAASPSPSVPPAGEKLCPVVNDVFGLLDDVVDQSVTPAEAATRLRRDHQRVQDLLPRLRAEASELAGTAADLARHLERTAERLEGGDVTASTADLATIFDDVQTLQEEGLRC